MTSWTWLGDHLAVDFANTVREVGGAMVDLIPTVDDFTGWLGEEAQRLPQLEELSEDGLRDLRQLRDSILSLLHAATAGGELPAPAVTLVNDAVFKAATTRTLIGVGQTQAVPACSDPVMALRGMLAAAAIDLLAREDLANLALCRAPGCGQFFHRARPNQRWCSPGCGNRARVDRHRHRQARPAGQEP
ncbi:CGNR zinc finger domain-containing protein [Ornithinimicrobium pratense]|uniref:CGNR zinc finger domain-containing protein n=1 Tax=Ornithinimicrobium pratense TaxID=2593973 RepID=A0A5J6V342_9MICO|nr:CGNR zinc finger domain-containing protein [Ornithinimicrobium pratense]QFG67581.1 CGNR zinc finger domain-containing protein [Ornithinimicrobium pratense]